MHDERTRPCSRSLGWSRILCGASPSSRPTHSTFRRSERYPRNTSATLGSSAGAMWCGGCAFATAATCCSCWSSNLPKNPALRFLVYVSLLYQELARNQAPVLDSQGRLPLVLPVVLYNGDTPWTAARQVEELIQPADGPLASNRPSQRHHLVDERHMAVDDLPQSNLVTAVVPGTEPFRGRPRRSRGNVAEVSAKSGRCREAGIRRLDAGDGARLLPEGEHLPVTMTLEEVEMTLVERVGEWPKQWMREGIEQGLAHERALLRRQAYARFGSTRHSASRRYWPASDPVARSFGSASGIEI